MMGNDLISIIVPVYKVEKYLKRCIDSVLSQSYSNWEMILVDDGSPDKCPQICDTYASKDHRIKVIHKENGGLSSARNAGLDVITGSYVTFLDSDDYLHSDALNDIYQVAISEQADIVQFSFIRGCSDVFPSIKKMTSYHTFDNHSIFYSSFQKIILWGKLYKTLLWDGIRMPVGKINEDDATTWKLYYRSSRTVCLDTAYYYYYENPNSIMAQQNKAVRLDFIDAYLERIAFFEQKQDKFLLDLSKWRFCLPLMLNYIRGNVYTKDLPLLLSYFKEHVGAALSCSKVPFAHRVLLATFNFCPQVFRKIFMILGKAHNL